MLQQHKDISLSFTMIVQNEETNVKDTLENIKQVIQVYGENESELVIIDGGSIDGTVEICKQYTDNVYYKRFNGDFSEQKNFATSKTRGKWVFNIDADEKISFILMNNLKELLLKNAYTDLIYVPRINKVSGITQEHIQKWNWKIDADKDINWPDYQSRIWKGHKPGLKWEGKVHETIKGFETFGMLSSNKLDGYYLIHNKSLEKQEKQNNYYIKLKS